MRRGCAMIRATSERSSAWLEHLVWDQDVAGSNPVAPTIFFPASLSPVNAARHAGFGDDDFFQERKFRTKTFPNPCGEVFARGIFKAGNLVQIIMVEAVEGRFEGSGNIG